jgi:hypothetical protein
MKIPAATRGFLTTPACVSVIIIVAVVSPYQLESTNRSYYLQEY